MVTKSPSLTEVRPASKPALRPGVEPGLRRRSLAKKTRRITSASTLRSKT